MAPVGFLVVQPQDGQERDPLNSIGGAMKLAAEQIRCRAEPETAGIVHHKRILRGASAVQATLGPAAVYDPLGQPLPGPDGLRRILGTDFDAHASLFETWIRLGGRPLHLPNTTEQKHSIETSTGLTIRLETGVHVGTIECYILRAVNPNTNPEGSPC